MQWCWVGLLIEELDFILSLTLTTKGITFSLKVVFPFFWTGGGGMKYVHARMGYYCAQ